MERIIRNPFATEDINDVFENVTILYADIAGFTKYSSQATSQNVFSLLENFFSEFDKMTIKFNVYKLYTIGDCYVAMGFIDAEDRNYALEAKNVTKMAFSMIDYINEANKLKEINLNMRIGIHTVYFKKFNYKIINLILYYII